MPTKVEMEISDQMMDLLKDLQVRTGQMNVAGAIRIAVSVYDALLTHVERGGDVVLRKDNKLTHTIKVLPDREDIST